MIVQTAPAGEPQFVIKMTEHTAFAGAMARIFGNDTFEPVSPREEMLYVIDHHDQGWAEFDAAPLCDTETLIPYHLTSTPREITLATAVRSPDFNEAHHPYCGLISSMHIWGLYNGRYGFSDHVLLNDVPEDYRARFDKMLDGQLERQARLKAILAANPGTAGWIEDAPLFQGYKQLQLFDTLALYFNCAQAGERRPADFRHVPRTADEDVTVTVEPVGDETYRFSPFPWSQDGADLSFEGRYLSPSPDATEQELMSLMRDTTIEKQTVRFVA
ncbi:MAG TPA: DUF3891 family protein [Alphaproteobacteria bacterium]|nr:DUF3891 family protein [Alphaproteobacteria bacterium]